MERKRHRPVSPDLSGFKISFSKHHCNHFRLRFEVNQFITEDRTSATCETEILPKSAGRRYSHGDTVTVSAGTARLRVRGHAGLLKVTQYRRQTPGRSFGGDAPGACSH